MRKLRFLKLILYLYKEYIFRPGVWRRKNVWTTRHSSMDTKSIDYGSSAFLTLSKFVLAASKRNVWKEN